MAIPIIKTWMRYFSKDNDEGLGSSYERILVNNLLQELIKEFGITSILEVPVFGFTGISGINSMGLAKMGLKICLVDNNPERITFIKNIWQETTLKADIFCCDSFSELPFSENSFDLSWNYASLWFVDDLTNFLNELNRLTTKLIVIFVPNRTGLGYLSQKYFSGAEFVKYLNEKAIIPKNIIRIMNKNQWKLVRRGFIDNPPWPDIGMSKHEFLKLFGLSFLIKTEKESKARNCILDYYKGIDPDFKNRMLKHNWFEKIAPTFIKFFWAHHKYLIFRKT